MIKIVSILVFGLVSFNSFAAERIEVKNFDASKIQPGRIAFIKVSEAKLIEIDMQGNTTLEFKIPSKYTRGPVDLAAGPDIEWVSKTDTFLIAIPKVGAIEVDRSGKVVWEYLTKDISHDIDLLGDGTLVFVNGWDSDTDYILTRINRRGEILERFTADEIGLNRADRRFNRNERYSNTHANAVQSLRGGGYLVSLRNYNRAVVVNNRKITRYYRNAKLIHDPVDVGKHVYFVRHERVNESRIIKIDKATRARSVFVQFVDEQWTPLRTLEPLRNGNFLVTGSTAIGQISKTGDLVWQVNFLDFEHQLTKNRKENFIYKATFVYK